MRSWLGTLVVLSLTCFCVTAACYPQARISIRVVDENGVPVPDAAVVIQPPNASPITLRTDYLGRARFAPSSDQRYSIAVQKPGFYVLNSRDVALAEDSQFVLTHQQQIQEQVNVVGSPPAIDPEQTSDATRMQT